MSLLRSNILLHIPLGSGCRQNIWGWLYSIYWLVARPSLISTETDEILSMMAWCYAWTAGVDYAKQCSKNIPMLSSCCNFSGWSLKWPLTKFNVEVLKTIGSQNKSNILTWNYVHPHWFHNKHFRIACKFFRGFWAARKAIFQDLEPERYRDRARP